MNSMMEVRLAAVLRLAIGTIMLFGCGSARRSEPVQGEFAFTQEQQRGERVFMEHCNRCHPGGAAGFGPALNNKPIPQALIRLQVREGFGEMPAFSEEHISDAELDAVASYLDALRDKQ